MQFFVLFLMDQLLLSTILYFHDYYQYIQLYFIKYNKWSFLKDSMVLIGRNFKMMPIYYNFTFCWIYSQDGSDQYLYHSNSNYHFLSALFMQIRVQGFLNNFICKVFHQLTLEIFIDSMFVIIWYRRLLWILRETKLVFFMNYSVKYRIKKLLLRVTTISSDHNYVIYQKAPFFPIYIPIKSKIPKFHKNSYHLFVLGKMYEIHSGFKIFGPKYYMPEQVSNPLSEESHFRPSIIMLQSVRMTILLLFDEEYLLIEAFYPTQVTLDYLMLLLIYIQLRKRTQFIQQPSNINFSVNIKQSIIIMIKVIFFTSLIILSCSLKELIRFPISFTIIRNIQLPQSFTKFQSDTGCCKSDSLTNVSSSYNLISLDGFSSNSTLTSLQNSPTPLGIWLNAMTTIGGGKDQPSASSTAQLQISLLNTFHNSGNLLIFNALGRQAPVSALKLSPTSIASNIINVLSNSNLDGVSIQFEDYHSVAKGTASQWLNTLLSTLRNQIDDKIIVLIIPPTFLLRMDIFQDPSINAYGDFFVLKYFDTNLPTYNNYQSLFTKNIDYPKTSFMQLINNDSLWIDFCKVIIAKPASSNVARTSGNFIDGASLKTGFNQLYTNINWFGGYANLDFKTDTNLDFQRSILQDIRNNCFQDSNCICS